MEDIIVQSAMAEIAMWDAFHTGRQANATVFLATVIGFWVAARFSSVVTGKKCKFIRKNNYLLAFGKYIYDSIIVFTNIGNFGRSCCCIAAFRC